MALCCWRRRQTPHGAEGAQSVIVLIGVRVCAAQLRNFAVPASLEGVSLGTVLLATTGNALMVPRALVTDDAVWFVGSSWGSLFGWAQLLSLYLARTPAGWVSGDCHQFAAWPLRPGPAGHHSSQPCR